MALFLYSLLFSLYSMYVVLSVRMSYGVSVLDVGPGGMLFGFMAKMIVCYITILDLLTKVV